MLVDRALPAYAGNESRNQVHWDVWRTSHVSVKQRSRGQQPVGLCSAQSHAIRNTEHRKHVAYPPFMVGCGMRHTGIEQRIRAILGFTQLCCWPYDGVKTVHKRRDILGGDGDRGLVLVLYDTGQGADTNLPGRLRKRLQSSRNGWRTMLACFGGARRRATSFRRRSTSGTSTWPPSSKRRRALFAWRRRKVPVAIVSPLWRLH